MSARGLQTSFFLTAQQIRLRFWAWTAAMLIMLVVLGAVVVPKLKIETDILVLLPTTQDDAISGALDHLSSSLAQRQIFLIGAEQLGDAKQAAQAFADILSASQQFATVNAQVGGDLRAIVDSYQPHATFLLSDHDRERLRAGEGDALYRDALRAAYTPSGMARLLPLAQDPLGTLGNFLQQQLPSLGNAHLDGSMLIATSGGKQYVLITVETKGSAFAENVQDQVLPVIATATQAAKQVSGDIEVLTSGALQHAAAARQKAQQEINTFGGIETIAVLALMFFVFGRFRPLILGALVLGLSVAAALTASHFIFGQVHILALVFGASLIGVVIDYSMHFFADQFRDREHWAPTSALAHVGPAIVLGMVTTLVGYAGLVLMPFPGLRQIAAFCMVGIVVGCGSVLCLYPYLMDWPRWFGSRRKPLPLRGLRLATAMDTYLQQWRWTNLKVVTVSLLAAAMLAGAVQLHVQDDIRALQASPPELLLNERRVQEVLSGGIETRFFLVEATTENALLRNEEQLRARLDQLVAAHDLGSYLAVTRALPSEERQRIDHDLMAQNLYLENGPFGRLMKQFGFSEAQIAARRLEFLQSSEPLTAAQWLTSPASAAYRHLWLGKIGDQFATVVTLSGIHSVAKLTQIATDIPGARFIDRPLEVSSVLSRYRQVTSGLLLFANFAALLVLSRRFGWRDAVRLSAPSIAACVATLGVFGWLGIGFNLFNAFALLLVLALGIDYGIFLMHGREARTTAILSVTLSACTTLIGFGMLAFSATPFIRSIGATLLLGIVCSWAFVMLSCMTVWREQSHHR